MAQTITTVFEQEGLHISQLKVSDLGVYAYYLQIDGQGILIDPFISPAMIDNLKSAGHSPVKHVLLTRFPYNYVSGHSSVHGADIHGPVSTKASLQYKHLKEGDSLKFGAYVFQVLSTPGSSSESISLILADSHGKTLAVFTGDSLNAGGLAIPDPTDALNHNQLVEHMFHSLQKFKTLDGQTKVFPGHGMAHFWGKGIEDTTGTTIADQLQKNKFLNVKTVEELNTELHTHSQPPKYYYHVAKLNRQQHAITHHKEPQLMTIEQVDAHRSQPGTHILDMRRALPEILKGSIESDLLFPAQGHIALWAGTLFPETDKLIVMTEKEHQQENVRRLHRVGCTVIGICNFTIPQWIAAGKPVWMPEATGVVDACKYEGKKVILDVRTKNEWVQRGVVQGGLCSYFPDVEGIAEAKLPKDARIFVYCRLALRARIATSILHNLGYKDVKIVPETIDDISKLVPMVPFSEQVHH